MEDWLGQGEGFSVVLAPEGPAVTVLFATDGETLGALEIAAA